MTPADNRPFDALDTQAMRDVLAECRRQVEEEGFTIYHDDNHSDGALAQAAVAYVVHNYRKPKRDTELVNFPSVAEAGRIGYHQASVLREAIRDRAEQRRKENPEKSRPRWWPWSVSWWKVSSPRRMLVKAAALLIKEIERIDRADAKKDTSHD